MKLELHITVINKTRQALRYNNIWDTIQTTHQFNI